MNIIKDFFYLQRNDRQALIALLAVIIASITIILIIGHGNEEGELASKNDSTLQETASEKKPLYYKQDGMVRELFPFDPNTADSTQLLRLGLKPWQVRSIYRYRAHGGIYSKPSDFAHLYGLSKGQYETLAPYIKIADAYRPAADFYGKDGYSPKSKRAYAISNEEHRYSKDTSTVYSHTNKPIYHYPRKLQPGQHIALNTADTTELKKIPGIGSYYARAIIRYRDRLGGFVSPQQLGEIDGVPESAMQYVSINSTNIRKLNVNKLSLEQLRKHPYINFYQARAICEYRRLNGPLHSLQELKLLEDFPPAAIERLLPYICF